MKITTHQQQNFQFATIEKDTPVVSIVLTADCLLENSPKQTAINMIYTDLLLSGAGQYNRDEFLYAINELGSNISVSEGEGRISIVIKTLDKNLDKTLKLFELMLTEPTFSEDECVRAIETTNNALIIYGDDSRSLAHDALRRVFYEKNDRHYEFTPEEIREELKTIKAEALKKLHNHFMKCYWTISVGGKTTSIKVSLRLVEKIKKAQAVNEVTLFDKKEIKKSNKKLLLQSINSKQNIDFSIGGILPLTFVDNEFAPFNFGLAVLGKWGGFAGRLMSTVREKEGLTYGIYAKSEAITKTESGYWRIMTFFAPKDVVKGISSTLREVSKIQKSGITQSEWLRFKDIQKTSEVLVYDSLAGTVGFVHGTLLLGLEFDEYRKYRERLYTCSRSEVNLALKKYLDIDNLVISGAGPIEKVEKDLKNLIK